MAQRKPIGNEPIVQLAAALPPFMAAANGEDLDQRARATLSLLIDQILKSSDIGARLAVDPTKCPNCDQQAVSKTSPYCSDCCRERAAFIRQMRAGLENGTLLADDNRQTMKGEVLWRLLGAGLPRRLALVPEKARERVLKNAEGKCDLCGAPAITIDNTGSG